MNADELAAEVDGLGLKINPSMSLEDRVQLLGENNTCPEVGESCPCAIAKEMIGSEEALCCPASFLCTAKYVDISEVPAEAPKSEEDELKEKAMKLQGLFDEVQALVDAEEYTEALSRIQDAMEQETCELCMRMLLAEASRINTVASVCSLPSATACTKEKDMFNTRFRERMKEISGVVDEIGSYTPDNKPTSPFQACVGGTSLTPEQLSQLVVFQEARRHRVEHGIRSMMCSNKPLTFEEALGKMVENHQDWLTTEALANGPN